MADDQEAVVAYARLDQRLFDLSQQAHVLLRAEPADVTDHEVLIQAGSACGRKQFRVDTARHQESWAAGAAREQFHQLGVRREDQLCQPIKPHAAIEGEFLEPLRRCGPCLPRQKPEHLRETPRAELVQIRVPGCHQRHADLVRENRTEDSRIARSGDVHQVRLKILQRRPQTFAIAQRKKIDRQVVFQIPAHWPALEFERGDGAMLKDVGARSGVHGEHGLRTPLGEADEFAAGKRDPVDFMKAVGEESDAPFTHRLTSSALEKAPRRKRRNCGAEASCIAPTKKATGAGVRSPNSSVSDRVQPSSQR